MNVKHYNYQIQYMKNSLKLIQELSTRFAYIQEHLKPIDGRCSDHQHAKINYFKRLMSISKNY